MSDFTQIHTALFDELERQNIRCVDVGKLTAAVMRAQAIIQPRQHEAYQRCEACE